MENEAMLSPDCLDVESIGAVLDLPPGDARRRHVESCARCSTILLTYREFLRAGVLPGSDPIAAGKALERFLKEKVGPSVQETRSGRDGPKRGPFPRLMSRFFQARPAWAAAVLLVIAAGLFIWHPWSPPAPVLRAPPGVDGTGAPLALGAPLYLDGGGIRLSWRGVEGADAYQVRIYGSNLVELVRLDPVEGTTVDMWPDRLPKKLPSPVLWRVVALQGGDEIGASSPSWLELP